MLISMFLWVIVFLGCISMIESTTCNRSKERTMISEMRSLLESLENKINESMQKYGRLPCEDYRLSRKLVESVKHHHGSWIGASDLKKEGDCRWIHDSSKVCYSKWHPGQPSNYGNNEDCGHFASGYEYEWNDAPCNIERMGYICECSHGSSCRPFNG
ncbi:C-type lectin domain family 17, member A-like [Mytilus californianus]|uniref:C-type lectin domain family 17, member A-like n=1 Tax=Mytilus californianus TaxID=6549 RepID=UPI002246A12D|nr:C-type lectin domain family 17, member A-like [Mytilus californianus]